ncbi:MAG: adenylyltransferase/cytidyltransferase family protein [Chloroflexi bacterium]|nr:adenylyltransferase/cytidyltransferase family protein [Chloroflexota bacterium]
MGSVVSLETLHDLLRGPAGAGKRVVLTNGYFDLLHPGHTRYLQQARALGDLLVVGVNVDATARRAKDPRRPIVAQEARAEVVAALACVDYVVLFAEDTAERLVSLLRPHVYVKGGDYGAGRGDPPPEAPAVEAHGGRVVLLPFQEGFSTTKIIETVVERFCSPASTT